MAKRRSSGRGSDPAAPSPAPSPPPPGKRGRTSSGAAAPAPDLGPARELSRRVLSSARDPGGDLGALAALADGDAVESTLWPAFLAAAAAGRDAGGVEDDDGLGEVAEALAALTVRRHASGAGRGDGLRYVADAGDGGASLRTAAFALLVRELLARHDLAGAADGAGGRRQPSRSTGLVRFLVASYSSVDLRFCPDGGGGGSGAAPAASSRVLEGPLTDLVGVRLYDAVPRRRRDLDMARDGLLRKRRGLYEKRRGDGPGGAGFLPGLVGGMMASVSALGGSSDDGRDGDGRDGGDGGRAAELAGHASKCMELVLDLLSCPQTRPCVLSYLDAHNVSVRLALSAAYRSSSPGLLRRQVDMLIDSERPGDGADGDGTAVRRAHALQKLLHRHHREEAGEVVFAGAGRVSDPKWLGERVALWTEGTLYDVCRRLRLVDDGDPSCLATDAAAAQAGCSRRDLLASVLLYRHSARQGDASVLSSSPLYPTESVLWDPHGLPPGRAADGGGDASLSLPKMGARFLGAADYLLRSQRLYRLESAYGIRADLVDAVRRMDPSVRTGGRSESSYYAPAAGEAESGPPSTHFGGWARMALELGSGSVDRPGLRIVRVDPPRLGQRAPRLVAAELVIDLRHCSSGLAAEWDGIGEHDNLFLVSVDAASAAGGDARGDGDGRETGGGRARDDEDPAFPSRYGVAAVRGCAVLEVRDEAGTVLSDPSRARPAEGGNPPPKGTVRYLRVALDAAQFAIDAAGTDGCSPLGVGVYDTFNMVVRRHGRENNFRSVLETMSGLTRAGSQSVGRTVPGWLMPVLLGQGDASAACCDSAAMRSYASDAPGVNGPDDAVDYGDTFVDAGHLRESFPGRDVVVGEVGGAEGKRRGYRVKTSGGGGQEGGGGTVTAEPYPLPPSAAGNAVRFTPAQVSAVRSGLNAGLTLVVGPPGTGKTDVAVQVISSLFRSFPDQRTVVVTHSNAALNDIFDKVTARGDVDERYMLRLGGGERDLTSTSGTSHDFTRRGRVAHIMSRRGTLLEEVQLMSESLGVSGRGERGDDGSPSYTCETAGYFRSCHVDGRIGRFRDATGGTGDDEDVADVLPLRSYLGVKDGEAVTLADARARLGKVEAVFDELAEYRPIELLRSMRQRTDYLLTKQAKIVCMTATLAAISRQQLVDMGFKYDSLIIEEAAQMLDIESFIPLVLQRGEADDSGTSCRLKRVCLIGDHNQLPPVVKNASFSRYSGYDQSMFSRLVRLGVPAIELDRQGRARPEIARLYSWRYRNLGNLDRVLTDERYLRANAGLARTFQLVNVEDFEGRGESTPSPFFYQNLGEAEYCVALFQYLVLIGYPPEKISILTTYNGQRELLNDILSQRCGEDTPLAGIAPGAVSTVDQYQGQQNDVVILSLVRTRAVGHLRDVRRLVVAVSRARLGLYVMCRRNVFAGCHELKRTMDLFAEGPSRLQLVKDERYGAERLAADEISQDRLHEVGDVVEMGSLVYKMQEEYMAGASGAASEGT